MLGWRGRPWANSTGHGRPCNALRPFPCFGARGSLVSPAPTVSPPPKPSLLILEFWGLGDLTFATPLLQAASEQYEITLVGKAHAQPLLGPSFPAVRFVAYDAPWSAYLGKYALWRWNWRELFSLLWRLRSERFERAISVRMDPRDHLFMWLVNAGRRYGFAVKGSGIFLTDPLPRPERRLHKVEAWRTLAAALGLGKAAGLEPRLVHENYPGGRKEWIKALGKPVVALHPGARIAIRRWPEPYFAEIVRRLRAEFDFHLLLIPDPDGYGSALAPLADSVLPAMDVGGLVEVLGSVDLLLCNDSGPGHIAAACKRPAIVLFGPTNPDWFRPYGSEHHVVIRDICPWRPCFDYCLFPEPYCLTKTYPEKVWPEIREHILTLLAGGVLPAAMRPALLPA